MTRNTYLLGTLVAALAGTVSAPASAEDVATSTEVTTEGQVNGEPAADKEEGDKDPMAWIGIGLKLGMGGNGEGEFETSGIKTTIKSRTGFQLAVPINMGGSGFGWLIEPYLNMASVDGADASGAAKSYGVTTLGFYTGPSINIHVMDPLYIGIGAGLKLGYSSSDAFDMGLDAFARMPITGTYYLLDDVAGVLELGLGYGGTGFAALPQVDATGQTVEGDLQFGTALTYDITAGVRWP